VRRGSLNTGIENVYEADASSASTMWRSGFTGIGRPTQRASASLQMLCALTTMRVETRPWSVSTPTMRSESRMISFTATPWRNCTPMRRAASQIRESRDRDPRSPHRARTL